MRKLLNHIRGIIIIDNINDNIQMYIMKNIDNLISEY